MTTARRRLAHLTLAALAGVGVLTHVLPAYGHHKPTSPVLTGTVGSTAEGDLPAERAVGIASTPDGSGFWTVTAGGRVRAYGAAASFGDLSSVALNAPVRGIVSTASGAGYWLVGADGGTFTFGDARFYGSTGGLALRAPIVSMAPTIDGAGYWLVGADGGVFSFGSARFYGSTGAVALSRPVRAISVSPTGGGYRMVGEDGGVFSFGDAPFFGSTGAQPPAGEVVGIAPAPGNTGYWTATSRGELFAFGSAVAIVNPAALGASPISGTSPVAGIAGGRTTAGFRVVLADGSTQAFGTNPPGGTAPTPAPAPVAPPAQVAAAGPFAFIAKNADGTPVRYDPCSAVRYVVRWNGEPAAARTIVDQVVAKLEAATGIDLVFAGDTTEVPQKGRPLVQKDRYGDGYAPIVIAFSRFSESNIHDGSSWGWGGSTWVRSGNGPGVFVTGQVVLAQDIGWSYDFNRARGLGPLLLHELSHVLGLDHVNDTTQIMNPVAGGVSDLGSGDREGLRQLGRSAGCLRTPDWRWFAS